ncbi:MAG: hypothetical protein JSV82_01885, partial [Planctomycetota bacterium]
NTKNQYGDYGTKGVADSNNVPGARAGDSFWIDAAGNIWLMGGYGYNDSTGPDYLNDMWKFNPLSGLWTWVGGSNLINQYGVYGTKGVADPNNMPGSRDDSFLWIDSGDNLWIFGGWGYAVSGSDGSLNDLWKFDGTNWTWVSGPNTTNQNGVYGTKGEPNSLNIPGARARSVSWTDNSDNLWLFGGLGFSASGDFGHLNDLWKFYGTYWTWVSGSNTTNQNGVYGTKGEPNSLNIPGAREGSASWRDSSGNLMLFGGYGYPASGGIGHLNDLWKFDGTNWTWVSGPNTTGQNGVYGTKGVADPNNVPGARKESISWIDGSGNLMLFGGYGYPASGGIGHLNDLWNFDGTNWTWISGPNTIGQNGIYGTKGEPNSLNIPGARRGSLSWTDSNDNLWLFGGNGYPASGGIDYFDYLNDLWKLTPHQHTLYVDANATGANNGTSWGNAYKYLQDALAEADSNPDINEILVAEGTYYPDANSANPGGTNDREATFQVMNGAAIYGAFPSSGGDWNSRDPNAYETILSGDINTPDVNSDNSYHVVTGSATDATAVLDGFTITAGYADGESLDNKGGGMLNYNNSSPTLTNCTFSGNSAGKWGGGMYNSSSDPNIINCTFIGNEAGDDGGGMGNYTASPKLTNCTFSGNWAADDGGGMYNTTNSGPKLTNCTFSGNSATWDGGGMYNTSTSDPNITNWILWGNTDGGPTDESAQIYNNGSTPAVNYCCVQGWTGGLGGTGNIGGDPNHNPLFTDPNGPDDIAGTEDDNLRLSWDSNCIDAGDNNSVPADTADLDGDANMTEPIPWDLDGNPRFVDGDCNTTEIVDMGAYELDWAYIGDFAGGCDIDFVDFAYLALTWQKEDGDPTYDYLCDISIPADSIIDERDLKIFTDNWLAGE